MNPYQIAAAILAVIVLGVIIWRRSRKTGD